MPPNTQTYQYDCSYQHLQKETLQSFSVTLRGRNYANLQAEYAKLNDIGHFAVSAEGLTKGLVSVFGK